ncbi:anaerobic ribonucleoside triphosphate reductase [Streptococcus acidominimus]|uniref:Anaerobic ribonucleoside triphosphate reductase n=1 Tax=Streptococcus acidominimus TaxID=1326 RepID=A0A380JKM5_STRAI|nr:anaerobic ribonucleoside triphosphate reductase [Streptococcus acidominimus]
MIGSIKQIIVPDILVLKRDGRTVAFDADKILAALGRASDELEHPCSEAVLHQIVEAVLAEIRRRFHQDIQIYEIQTIVEQELLKARLYDLAEVYIQYRTKRDFERHQAMDINFTIEKLLTKDQTVVNENANKDSDVFNTQRDLTAGIVGKSIGLKLLPEHVANAHQKGDLHFHDLDYSPYTPMTNCCLIDFKGCWQMVLRLGMPRWKVLSLSRQLLPRFRRLLRM